MCPNGCSGQHAGFTEAVVTEMSTNAGAPTLVRFGTAMDHGRKGAGPQGPLPLPRRCMLSHVLLECVSKGPELSLPDTVTWWLTADREGNVVMTDRVTEDWNNSQVDEYGGGVASRIDLVWVEGLQAQSLYLWLYAKDNSDVLVRPRITWYTLSDWDLSLEHAKRLDERV